MEEEIDSNKSYLIHINRLIKDRFNWQEYAKCFKSPRGTMYPPRHDAQEKTTQKYCRNCPVKLECLYLALVSKEEFGVWGGTTENQRIVIQNKIISMGHIKIKENWSEEIQRDIYQLSKDVIVEQNHYDKKNILEAQV